MTETNPSGGDSYERMKAALNIAAEVAARLDWDETNGVSYNAHKAAKLGAIRAFNKRDSQVTALVNALEDALAFLSGDIADRMQRNGIIEQGRQALVPWENST